MSDTKRSCLYWRSTLSVSTFPFYDLPEELQLKVIQETFLDFIDQYIEISAKYPIKTATGSLSDLQEPPPEVKYSFKLPKFLFLVNKHFYKELKTQLSRLECSLSLHSSVRAIQQQPRSRTRTALNEAVKVVDSHNIGALRGELDMLHEVFPNAAKILARTSRFGLCDSGFEGIEYSTSRHISGRSITHDVGSQNLMAVLRGACDDGMATMVKDRMMRYFSASDWMALHHLTLQIPYRFHLNKKKWEDVYQQYEFPGPILVIVVAFTHDRCWIMDKHFADYVPAEFGFQWNLKIDETQIKHKHDHNYQKSMVLQSLSSTQSDTTLFDSSKSELKSPRTDLPVKTALPQMLGVNVDVVEGIPRAKSSGWCGTGAIMQARSWFAG